MPKTKHRCPKTHDLDGLHRIVLEEGAEACCASFLCPYFGGWFYWGLYRPQGRRTQEGYVLSPDGQSRTILLACDIRQQSQSLVVSAKHLHFGVQCLAFVFSGFPIKGT